MSTVTETQVKAALQGLLDRIGYIDIDSTSDASMLGGCDPTTVILTLTDELNRILKEPTGTTPERTPTGDA